MVFVYITIGIVALVLLAAALLYFIVFYSKPCRSTRPLAQMTPSEERVLHDPMIERSRELVGEILRLPFERVAIRSFDGLTLAGRYYNFSDGAPLALLVHGYRSTAVIDFRGIFQTVRALGFNILLVSQRAHGESEGSTIAFGIKEKRDCRDWVRYAAERFGESIPIVLFGVSMGAATVLMSSDTGLPKSVRCIVADCGYTSPDTIIRCVLRTMKRGWAYPLVFLGALLFGRLNLCESGAIDAVKNTELPILFIHGEDDRFVPAYMSRELFEAAGKGRAHGKNRIETFKKARHLQSCLLYPERYSELLDEFLRPLFYEDKP